MPNGKGLSASGSGLRVEWLGDQGPGASLLGAEVLVHRRDEHVRRPETAGRTVSAVVVQRRLGRPDLLPRSAFLDQVLDAIANDGYHVTILEQVGFIAQPAVTGNDVGAAF